MSRTPLFSKLRATLSKAWFARKRGLTDPEEIERAWEEQRMKRRRFLQISAGAVAVAALPTATEGCGGPTDTTPDETEPVVAVVGGGMAGLHCAYRLDAAGVKVTVYDAAKRSGGRMYTARDKLPEGLICELGGELIDTQHATMWMLSDEFEIDLDDRWKDEPAGLKRDVYYMAGAEIPEATILDEFMSVADVMAMDTMKADSDDAAFEEIDNTSLQEWLDTRCPKAMYPAMHDILLYAYRNEYGLECDEQSCLNLLYFIDWEHPETFAIFGASDERYHTHLGNDTFPTKLAEKLAGKIELETKLISAKDGDGGKFVLTFEKADKSKLEVTADHVVFALPFTLLREVDLTGLTLSDLKRQMIDELGYGTNAKIMTAYDERVWLTQHNSSGSLITDLTVQQTWDTSIGQAGTAGVITNFLGGDGGLKSDMGTPEEYHMTVLPDLEQVWPGMQSAYVANSAIRMHWPTYELTKGSYACYKPGQWSFWTNEGKSEGNLHFCGEHTSVEFQGFMEGAAETGALAAGAVLDALGIKPTPQHAAILQYKLVLPQPWFPDPSAPRLSVPQRRRIRMRLLEEALAAETPRS